MPATVRLYRRPVYERLERIGLKWDKLSYCRFCIQAEDEINPDRLEDLDHNYSVLESIRGYVRRDLMTVQGRPNLYLTNYFNNLRHQWNKDPARGVTQLYVVGHEAIIARKPTFTNPERSRQIVYNFLQTLRGRQSVGDVDKRLHDGADGIAKTRDRIQGCINGRRVDQAIDEVLKENEMIQQGQQGGDRR